MQINRGTDYAIRAMLHLTRHRKSGPILLADLAQAVDAPANYLSNVFQTLTRFNLVQSHRGARRGYSLARDPKDISLLDIVEALEGPLVLMCCMDDPDSCPLSEDCLVTKVFNDLRATIRKKLEGQSLALLTRRGRDLEPSSDG